LRDRSPRRRNRNPGELRKHALGGALAALSLGALVFGAYAYFTARPPPALDRVSLCPIPGARSVTVVLIDSTDVIPEVGKREIGTLLLDMAEAVPAYGLLDLRLLDPKTMGGRVIFSKCNPGDGSGLSEYTANPGLAKKRWLEEFRQPLEEALAAGFQPAPEKTSPIIETVQRIAVDRFSGRAAQEIPKALVLISDMLENEPDYSQYSGDLSYSRYRNSRAY
jgi:hypothetical protein